MADYEKAYREGLQLKARLDERVSVAMKPEAEKLANAAAAVKESGTAEQQAIEAATLDAIGATQNLLIALAAGGLVLGFAVAWLIGGGVSRPVLRITEAMHRLASGDLEAEIPALDRADEVGADGAGDEGVPAERAGGAPAEGEAEQRARREGPAADGDGPVHAGLRRFRVRRDGHAWRAPRRPCARRRTK